MMTRRQFIEKLKAIAILASIAPAIIEAMEASTDAVAVSTPYPYNYPKLTLSMLEESYMLCVYGYQEPDMMVMAPDVYADFMELWTTLKDSQRFLTKDQDITLPYFNGAAVTFSRALPRRSWLNLNSSHPKEPRYSGFFSADKLEWSEIPKELPHG